jgi:SAM-dependent methyltransferase
MAKYDFFSKSGMTVAGSFISGQVGKKIIKTIFNLGGRVDKVLEIGPGRGFFAKYFCSNGIAYVCYEPNEKLREPLSLLGAVVRKESVPPINEPVETFDLVIISHVLEHMETPNVVYQLIAEASRVLKKGGSLVLFSPDARNWGMDFYDIDATHNFVTTPSRMISVLDDIGFEVLQVKNLFGMFSFFPGIIVDKIVSTLFLMISTILPSKRRLVKGKSTFHANTLVVSKKISSLASPH